jgi:penicillin-binding protein 1A
MPKATNQISLSKKTQNRILILLWLIITGPVLGLMLMILIVSFDDLPTLEQLENPVSNLASEIISSDNQILGKYYEQNRTNVEYNQISPYVIDCLIATEDERFYNHSGVDVEAIFRVAKGVISSNTSQGGGSTLSQQLSKMLFPREKMNTWQMVKRKFKEWIISTRIEKSYTKEEILTMYLNQFDFLYNAVGIHSAARVYFNTTPDSLKLEQAAMLVGMAKNPSMYNPLKFEENAIKRREVVLKQLLKNNNNPHIKTKINRQQYDSLRLLPLAINYQKVDHQEGLAPYFREVLRTEITQLLNEKNENGEYKIRKKDGSKYDVYKDGLKIYTTIDTRMQKYAEWAVEEHLKKELQKEFDKDHKRFDKNGQPKPNWPFVTNYKITQEKVDEVMNAAIKRSDRYLVMSGKKCGKCERNKDYIKKEKGNYVCTYCKHETKIYTQDEIDKIMHTPTKMRVFSWYKKGYEFDTLMSPVDSIRYYKSFLLSGLISMDPKTGFVKAWVGGPYFKHFKLDHVKQTRRQVGSTFKPFVYAAAFRDRLFTPCSEAPNIEYCIEVPHTAKTTKPWCPKNPGVAYTGEQVPLYYALAASWNNITAYIIKHEKPATVVKMLENMGIPKGYLPPVPSICLGACELSVYEMTGAQSSFANKGVYIKPIYFTRIEDKNGNVIYDVEPEMSEAMDEETAYMMLQIMKGVTSGVVNPHNGKAAGTATRIRSNKPYGNIKAPIAGKTGTTNDQSDGWFIGITPDLVTGVWVGCEDMIVRFSTTNLGQGANMALPIWGYYMNKVYADKSLKISQSDFEAPEGNSFDFARCKDFKTGGLDLIKLGKIDEFENLIGTDEEDESQ